MPLRSPKSVANFLAYVDSKHYDGTVFHRVIPTHGAGRRLRSELTSAGRPSQRSKTRPTTGSRTPAARSRWQRTGEPHSATAQFFVNVADNKFLDHTAKDNQGWGYAVFGRVTEGMDVVDKIKDLKTSAAGPFAKDAPVGDHHERTTPLVRFDVDVDVNVNPNATVDIDVDDFSRQEPLVQIRRVPPTQSRRRQGQRQRWGSR